MGSSSGRDAVFVLMLCGPTVVFPDWDKKHFNTLRLSPSKLPIVCKVINVTSVCQFCPKGSKHLIHLQEHLALCFLFAAWWDQNHFPFNPFKHIWLV